MTEQAKLTVSSIHKHLHHQDFTHMSIDLFHESSKPNHICYRVVAAELEFLGSRAFAPTETFIESIQATVLAADLQLTALVQAQKDQLTSNGQMVQ